LEECEELSLLGESGWISRRREEIGEVGGVQRWRRRKRVAAGSLRRERKSVRVVGSRTQRKEVERIHRLIERVRRELGVVAEEGGRNGHWVDSGFVDDVPVE